MPVIFGLLSLQKIYFNDSSLVWETTENNESLEVILKKKSVTVSCFAYRRCTLIWNFVSVRLALRIFSSGFLKVLIPA